jgi:superfamily II DNA or RNA helicase
MSGFELRPRQRDLICNIFASMRAGQRRIMAQAPTGFGKTVVAVEIIRRGREHGRRILFTVPRIDLIDQTVARLMSHGITDVGVIQGNHPMTAPHRPVQVASVQSLHNRDIPPANLVMIDEAHLDFKFVREWMADPAWASIPFVGLTATPWTKGLGRHCGELIVGSTTRELIDDGELSPFRVWAPSSHLDLSKVRTVAGDYHEGQLAAAMMSSNALTADIVETWLKRGRGRPTLCFAVTLDHARHIRDRFTEAGVRVEYQDGDTPREERAAIKHRLEAGETEIIVSVGTLTTGFDADVRCIILARPTKSEMLFVQMIGRGLRLAPKGTVPKDFCLILDDSDNHTRLGFVTDIHHDELDDGTKKKPEAPKSKEALPKVCPQCQVLKPPKMATCPNCGFVTRAQSLVIHQDGELVELEGRCSKAARRANRE